MKCPHCHNYLKAKMATLTFTSSDFLGAESEDTIDAIVCSNCDTFIASFHETLMPKIDKIFIKVDEINRNLKH